MANIYDYDVHYMDDLDSDVIPLADAQEYATQVAREVLAKYQESQQKEPTMKNETLNQVAAETVLNSKLIGGEILLENIETLAEKLVLSRLSWWKRLAISKTDREIATTVATYAIVHALKTGGFGLTKYRIDHEVLDYVTIAANNRLLKYIQRGLGVDTNLAQMLFTKPTVSYVEGN